MARPKGSKNKKSESEQAPEGYSLHLQIGEHVYESKGATVLEALVNLKKPDKIMNKGVLTLTHGNLRSQQLFFPSRLKRLFYSPTFQVIQAKLLVQAGLKPIA